MRTEESSIEAIHDDERKTSYYPGPRGAVIIGPSDPYTCVFKPLLRTGDIWLVTTDASKLSDDDEKWWLQR